jgi:hypothetical protein
MSNTNSNSRPQGELFAVTLSSTSIVGLVIITDRAACPACGSNELLTGSSRGPHACDVRCNRCDRRRGWLSAGLAEFLQETVSRFGRPTAPIVLRNPSPIWSSGAGNSSRSNGN